MSAKGPLSGMRVVEAAQRIVGPFAGWHLGMLGAEVIKVEPPEGDIARGWEAGAMFDVLNEGKRCVAFDLSNTKERGDCAQLCASADIALADRSWSAEAALAGGRDKNARTRSVVEIDDGPVPGGSGTSETLAQASMALIGYVGEPGGKPVRLGADLASASAASVAVQAALAAFIRPDQPKPLVSRISIDRALATLKTIHWAARSDPDRWAGYHLRAISRQPDCGYRTRDGWITLDFLPDQREAWRAMCEELGLGDFAGEVEDNWFSTIGMEDSIDWARPRYEKGFAALTREEAIALIRKHGGWSVPFQQPVEAMHHPQSKLYASIYDNSSGAQVRMPWRVNDETLGVHQPGRAASVGAHTKEVLAALERGAS
jgi:crotonobetainyl-CoA:carnitine CoA-transferase CaiB-like acyl-CoA transferase